MTACYLEGQPGCFTALRRREVSPAGCQRGQGTCLGTRSGQSQPDSCTWHLGCACSCPWPQEPLSDVWDRAPGGSPGMCPLPCLNPAPCWSASLYQGFPRLVPGTSSDQPQLAGLLGGVYGRPPYLPERSTLEGAKPQRLPSLLLPSPTQQGSQTVGGGRPRTPL